MEQTTFWGTAMASRSWRGKGNLLEQKKRYKRALRNDPVRYARYRKQRTAGKKRTLKRRHSARFACDVSYRKIILERRRIERWKLHFPVRNSLRKWRISVRETYKVNPKLIRAMFIRQGHRCAICRVPLNRIARIRKQRACIDHCHSTGRVRGLLCVRCNLLVGHIECSKDLLVPAQQYLEKHKV